MLTAHYGAFRRAKTTPSRCQELSVGPVYFFGPFLGFFDFFFELAPFSDATTLSTLLCCDLGRSSLDSDFAEYG